MEEIYNKIYIGNADIGKFNHQTFKTPFINGKDLIESEEIKTRWKECTEELYKKALNDPDNQDVVVTHLEPDSLECEVKWALGNIAMKKVSGGDTMPAELFQILKDDAMKVLHSICQQIWKTQQWPQDWKRSVLFQSQRKETPKNVQITVQLHSFYMLARLCSKSFKLGFSENFQRYKLDLEKAQERQIKLPRYGGSQKKQQNSKKIYFCFTDYTKAFDCMDHNKL